MPTRTINLYSINAGTNTVTINTSAAHGMSASTYFTIKNLNTQLNGSYTVAQITSPTQFTFIKSGLSNANNIPVSAILIYANINNSGRPGYMYDEETDTWYLISGKADTGANYTWTGTHLFEAPVTFKEVVYNSQQVQLNASAINTSSVSATYVSANSALITGNLSVVGNVDIDGVLDANSIRESINSGIIVSNVLTTDYLASTINLVSASPSSNFTVNIINVPTDNNKAITITVIVTQGATGYIPNALQINNVSQTIRWVTGNQPVPTSSSGKLDVFSFTLIRSNNSWIVLGNSTLNL